jgi:hypothetical protein
MRLITIVTMGAIIHALRERGMELAAAFPNRTGGIVVVAHDATKPGAGEFPVWNWDGHGFTDGNYPKDYQTAMSTALVRAGWV